MSCFAFASIRDVASEMSGFSDWVFVGEASFDGFCVYVWEQHERYEANDKEHQALLMMRDYLLIVGQDPDNYAIGKLLAEF